METDNSLEIDLGFVLVLQQGSRRKWVSEAFYIGDSTMALQHTFGKQESYDIGELMVDGRDGKRLHCPNLSLHKAIQRFGNLPITRFNDGKAIEFVLGGARE